MSSVGAPGTAGPTPQTTGCVPLARNCTSPHPSRRSSPATHSAAARQSALCAGSVETDGMRRKSVSSRNSRSVSMARKSRPAESAAARRGPRLAGPRRGGIFAPCGRRPRTSCFPMRRASGRWRGRATWRGKGGSPTPSRRTGACWAECFELLRRAGRADDALRLAEAARAHFGEAAFPLALAGAALIELERYRDALRALERALDYDPDLALVWHELGYAAFRLGDRSRALLALDRAFALEPHTETLQLRGRI